MKPSRRDLSYSVNGVFFTTPCLVAKTSDEVSGKSLVDTIASMVSEGDRLSRFTTAVPLAVRSFIGISWPRRRKTRPRLENRSRWLRLVVWRI